MALQTYGGYTWSNQAPPELNPDSHKLIGLGFIGAAVTLGGYAATRTLENGYKPLDYIAASTRLGTNLSPMQLFNTFRLPEILSPYLSDKYRGTGSSNYGVWQRADIANNSSYQWIKNQTGLTDDALRMAGITSGMLGTDNELATELRYRPSKGSKGSLVSIMRDGSEREISKDMSLLAFNTEIINPFTTKKGVNKYTEGVMAASGVNDVPGFNVSDVFSAEKVHPGYIPVASPTGSFTKPGDLGRRTSLLRGIPAFEMARFGNLLEEVNNQFFGETGKRFLTNVLGLPSKFTPTSASKMFGKYGVAAAGVVGAGLAVQHSDWMREHMGLPGRIGASALVSGGLGHIASRMGMNSHKSFMLALGAFAGQMTLPGFDKGLLEGVATAGANLDVMRATPINPFSLYRRTLEGFAPGSTDWQTGAFLGIAGTLLATQNIPVLNQRLPVQYANRFGIPLSGANIGDIRNANTSIKDFFYNSLSDELGGGRKTTGFFNRLALKREYLEGPDGLERLHKMNHKFYEAEEAFSSIQSNNPLNTLLSDKLKSIHSNAGTGLLNDIKKDWAGFAQEAWHDLWGADLSRNKVVQEELRDLGFGKYAPTTRLGRAGVIFGSLFLGHQLLTGGLLGSMDSAQNLEDIYSGKKLVEIKKNRAWEGGGTPYEGSDSSYYRPHQYALMMNRVREKGIWGDEYDRNPLSKAFLKNFTYHLEEKNYWNRPYPVTGQAFSDIPIIGGLLGASVGQLIKPTKVMHSSEWIRENGSGLEYANVFKGNMMEPAYSLGAVGQGVPQMPNSFRALHADLTDQFRELEGMTGFAKNTMFGALFGKENWNTDATRLASSSDMTSMRDHFWEMEMGGAMFTNEFLRRVLPRKKAGEQSSNPVMNSMPSWIPDKFRWGDPYKSVAWGEARLPGPGFVALHPELSGLDPEAYPMMYKYQILADIAPFAPETFKVKNQLYSNRAAGKMSDSETRMMDDIDTRHSQVTARYDFNEMDERAIAVPGSGIVRSIYGAAKQTLRTAVEPGEYMIPMGFRPSQKLLGMRDPINQYEYERMYGTSLAFWNEPWRDWLRPAMYSTAHAIGFSGKPLWREEADQTGQYFDQLQFFKSMFLAENAKQLGLDPGKEASLRIQAGQTRTGYTDTTNPLSTYWSLPSEDRAFFNRFANADPSERKRIKEMVPSDQVPIYEDMWRRVDSQDPTLYNMTTKGNSELMQSKYEGLKQTMKLPDGGWIGWNSEVDLNDVKARYVDRIGADMHDYSIWEAGMRKSESQSFLDGSENFLFSQSYSTFPAIQSRVYNQIGDGMNSPKISMNEYPGKPYAHIDYNDSRDNILANKLNRYINGY
jgi:hypothetical protein